MTMNNLRAIAIAAIALFSTGCASVISKSDYSVSFTSDPTGANLVIKNIAGNVVHQGSTPETIVLDASNGFFQGATYTVEYTMEGYETQELVLDSKLDGWYLGNIIFGGLLGMLIIDPATGAMFSLDESLHSSLTENSKELVIIDINSLTDDQRASLVAVN